MTSISQSEDGKYLKKTLKFLVKLKDEFYHKSACVIDVIQVWMFTRMMSSQNHFPLHLPLNVMLFIQYLFILFCMPIVSGYSVIVDQTKGKTVLNLFYIHVTWSLRNKNGCPYQNKYAETELRQLELKDYIFVVLYFLLWIRKIFWQKVSSVWRDSI